MKKKVKFLIPEFIMEVLEKDCQQFMLKREGLCNKVFFAFSMNPISYDSLEIDFDKNVQLQFSLNKKNQLYYYEVLKSNGEQVEARLLRKIFLSYALLPEFLRESILYKQKIFFLTSAIKEEKTMILDTENGIREGKIEEIFRDKEKGYLKVKIEGEAYFLSDVRIV